MKNWVVKILALSMVLVLFVGCSGSDDSSDGANDTVSNDTEEQTDTDSTESTDDASEGDTEEGSVYFLNFKPEIEEVWQKIAKEYTESTGVDVKVVTAAAGTYEQTLRQHYSKLTVR
jgi:raffinose/stachyose/melibiose transport system substrate-binding protein